MSLLLTAALLASSAVTPSCSWDNPGHNPYMGDVVSAVDNYTDIPANIRSALKQKMAKRQYDDIATIKRDSIVGSKGDVTYTDLRDMHFGPKTLCKSVTRDKWSPDAVERGLVYCEQNHCIIVPTVCRNVSRVTYNRKEKPIESKVVITSTPEEMAVVVPPPPTLKMDALPLTFENVVVQQPIVPLSTTQASTFNGFTSINISVSGFYFNSIITNNTTNNITNNTTEHKPHEHKPHDHLPNVPDTPVTPIPEPSTWALILIGIVILVFLQSRRNKTYT